GIGTQLLRAAEQQASQQHFTKVALSVAQENQHALSLYQHLHYKITGQTILYQRHYVRLVKVLEARP
ncbi:MAG TPA: GNAT family N-acetyltransferase, partial [Ktedonobacteraceae bacterium]|nr:GNAT family N-acetyltransferase [Ktedonobacteraceae bacterium]